jgi:hypothetical protein
MNEVIIIYLYFQLRILPSLIHSIAFSNRFDLVASVFASSNQDYIPSFAKD